MGNTVLEREIRRRQTLARRSVGEELRAARENAGLSVREAGAAAGIDWSHLARVERGERALSLAATTAVGAVLGCDVSFRLFPTAGPRLRDRIQARMLEAVLDRMHSRWVAREEVAVYRPVRGVIDIVLQDRLTLDLVAGEGHSLLRSVERQLRWAGEKADSLPSATGWPWADALEPPRSSRLLVLRSCRAMHELVRDLPATFANAYPGDPARAVAALTGPRERWPADTLLWVDVRGSSSRLIEGAPRALTGILGRRGT